jgi:pimeloyl-ACP methyl ester carboxylesterase
MQAQPTRHNPGRTLALTLVAALLLGIGIFAAATGAGASAATSHHRTAARSDAPNPTIVLVHGAWANTSSWDAVIHRLNAAGYTAFAPVNPLQSLKGDSETIADFLKTIKGPIVLVGHSYGGMVITNAAYGNPNVKALVYVDAFAPAQGESALHLDGLAPGSVLSGPPAQTYTPASYPGAPAGDAIEYLQKAAFENGFANGLPAKEAATLFATQAAPVYSTLTAPSGPPAWKTIPSWYVLGTADHAIPPAVQLYMARRIHAHITKVHADHLSMIEAPGVVAKVIERAAKATS